jgi:predicted nucleic acid-binding protein
MSVSERSLYVLDTSALVKRYHPERGSEVVQHLFTDPQARRLITDITIIEFHSAFARRVRMREITPEDFQAAKAELAADIQDGVLEVEPLGDVDKAAAAQLLERYGLTQECRTLDALHLAVMTRLGPGRLRAVYCADHGLCAVLVAEGLTVINPEASPPA